MTTVEKYPISDCYPAIQGEGCNTGIPMVILRLQGCDVGCPFCDTKWTWLLDDKNTVDQLDKALGQTEQFIWLSPSEVNCEIQKRYPDFKWVMLTGGEPARWYLKPLIKALHDGGYKVALETSGTEIGHVGAGIDWICVSPKYHMPGRKELLPSAFAVAHEIKMVIGKKHDLETLEALLSTYPLRDDVTICLQPMSLSKRATELCIQTVQKRGWRLSIQTHQLLGLK